MAGITESELYAELVAAHRKPPPIQPGDITAPQFAHDTGMSYNAARDVLEGHVRDGRLMRLKRSSATGKWLYVYRQANG